MTVLDCLAILNCVYPRPERESEREKESKEVTDSAGILYKTLQERGAMLLQEAAIRVQNDHI